MLWLAFQPGGSSAELDCLDGLEEVRRDYCLDIAGGAPRDGASHIGNYVPVRLLRETRFHNLGGFLFWYLFQRYLASPKHACPIMM